MKISILITYLLFPFIVISQTSLGINYNNYWLIEKNSLLNTDYNYEKYRTFVPFQIDLKQELVKYIYFSLAIGLRNENKKTYASNDVSISWINGDDPNQIVNYISIKKDDIISSAKLYLIELPILLGFNYPFKKLNIFGEYGTIFMHSVIGTNQVFLSESDAYYKFKDTDGKYIDGQINVGIEYLLFPKTKINLITEYRWSVYRNQFISNDYKFIYRFPSYIGAPLIGLNLGIRRDL